MFQKSQKTKEQEKIKLHFAVRKVVLVIGLLCFLSTVTGVTLQLHLLTCEHNDRHDPEDCDICKQFFAANNTFILDSYTIITYFEDFTRDIQHSRPAIPGLFCLQHFNPRPPPFAS